MKNIFILFIIISNILCGQNNRAIFPQEKLNETSHLVRAKYPRVPLQNVNRNATTSSSQSALSMLNKIREVKNLKVKSPNSVNWAQSHDTIFVGVVPHDTMIITGPWHHSGPILVLNDGVLIFYKATVVDSGDIYVFQQGQMLADSSSLTFPQQYFYQRSLIAVQTATVYIANSSFNYSGLSHNLVVGNHAVVGMQNVHQND